VINLQTRLRPVRSVKGLLLFALGASVVYWSCSVWLMTAARNLIESSGPSEFLLDPQFGPNRYCGATLYSVGFWQQGPGIPERQGYVCGGLFSKAQFRIVPFDQGLTVEEIT
jgi:hypothetical protein